MSGVREFFKERFWWWPAVLGLYSIVGLIILYWYSEDIFGTMVAESAARYMVLVGSLLVVLSAVSMSYFAVKAIRHTRLGKGYRR